MTPLTNLQQQLDSFDPQVRAQALEALAASDPAPALTQNVNMHFHSFFSYNAEGWSPSHIAWAARQAGLYAAGLCDFDVLDGLEEFLSAGELLGLRCTVNLETRAYLAEFAEVDITSPGEPGVTYIMGAAFPRVPAAGSSQAAGLDLFRDGAHARNLDLVERINPHIPQIAVDYNSEVVPLTPAGGPTERHIIRAYVNKAEAVFGGPDAVADFWAEITGTPADKVAGMLGTPKLEELVRNKLAKRGGVGYVQPSEDTFPPVQDFIDWVLACDAVPMITWLDGTSGGESDPGAMLECMVSKGAAALNIIPDRNWNIDDPAAREVKVRNLVQVVEVAESMGLPINVGTEMNKAGLPFVDDLSGPVLEQFREAFLKGARIMVGHSVLARYAGRSYTAPEPCLSEKNRLFEAVGALPPLTAQTAAGLRELGPEGAYAAIMNAVAAGGW